jgi:hypothetical protein
MNYQGNRFQKRTAQSSNNYKPRQPHSQQAFTSKPAPVTKPVDKPAQQILGDRDLWVRLQQISNSESNTRVTTLAMTVPGGLVICTRTRTPHGLSEALVFVPGCGLGASGTGVSIVPSKSP